jgi:hypothetical protein
MRTVMVAASALACWEALLPEISTCLYIQMANHPLDEELDAYATRSIASNFFSAESAARCRLLNFRISQPA